jgi:tetratricopeptide (TPR) repeat protein
MRRLCTVALFVLLSAGSLASSAFDQAGRSAWNDRDWSGAESAWTSCLEVNRELGDMRGVVRAQSDLGWVYQELGKYPKALEFLRRSLALADEQGDERGVLGALNSIGIVYDILGDFPSALSIYQRALEAATALSRSRPGGGWCTSPATVGRSRATDALGPGDHRRQRGRWSPHRAGEL